MLYRQRGSVLQNELFEYTDVPCLMSKAVEVNPAIAHSADGTVQDGFIKFTGRIQINNEESDMKGSYVHEILWLS